MTEANKRQVGGDHYRKMPLEHWDLAALYGWDYFQARTIAYLMRWRDKAGIQDLEKAAHFIQKYIEIEKMRAAGTLTHQILVDAIDKLRDADAKDADDKVDHQNPYRNIDTDRCENLQKADPKHMKDDAATAHDMPGRGGSAGAAR